MKNFLLMLCVVLCSCADLNCDVSEWKQQEAQSMYNAFGTNVVKIDSSKAEKIFGACYQQGDDIYAYKTLWGKKYILARFGHAITYVEDDGKVMSTSVSDRYKNYNRGGVDNQQTPMQQNRTTQWY